MVPSVIHNNGVYTWSGGPLSRDGGPAGAAHRPKGVVLLNQERVQHIVTWAAAPEVMVQRRTACRHLGFKFEQLP